jgi:hypothetical protein
MVVCTTPTIFVRRVPGHGWGDDDFENERALETLVSAWKKRVSLGGGGAAPETTFDAIAVELPDGYP